MPWNPEWIQVNKLADFFGGFFVVALGSGFLGFLCKWHINASKNSGSLNATCDSENPKSLIFLFGDGTPTWEFFLGFKCANGTAVFYHQKMQT